MGCLEVGKLSGSQAQLSVTGRRLTAVALAVPQSNFLRIEGSIGRIDNSGGESQSLGAAAWRSNVGKFHRSRIRFGWRGSFVVRASATADLCVTKDLEIWHIALQTLDSCRLPRPCTVDTTQVPQENHDRNSNFLDDATEVYSKEAQGASPGAAELPRGRR